MSTPGQTRLTVCFELLPGVLPELVVTRLLDRYLELRDIGAQIKDLKLDLSLDEFKPPLPRPYGPDLPQIAPD